MDRAKPNLSGPPKTRKPASRAGKRPSAAVADKRQARKGARPEAAKASARKAPGKARGKAKAAAAGVAAKPRKARTPRASKATAPTEAQASPMAWEILPEPAPGKPAVNLLQPPAASPARRAGRILLIGLLVLGLAALGMASQVTSESNAGTIKVHDGAAADPPQRNEPHVTGDAFVEGFNMAADGGDLLFYSWPPTGDMTLVLATTWDADDGTPEFHFLAGPFDLPCGHYRVFAYNGDGPDDPAEPQPGGAKKKTFWVECDEEPGPGPEPEPEPTTSTGPSPSPSTSTGPSPTTSPGPEPEPVPEPTPERACPTDLTATPLPDGSVELSWTPAEGSDGTNVYRADGDGDFEYLTTTAAGVGTYVDATTAAGGAYAYLVTGLYGNEESEGCEVVEVTAIPDFPTVAGAALATVGGLLAFALATRRKA